MASDERTAWLTYSHADGLENVNRIVQVLEENGNVRIRMDRRDLHTGLDHWKEISEFIVGKNRCDAWLILATENTIGSLPVSTEFSLALQNAHDERGEEFPMIALFFEGYDKDLIPPILRSRLCQDMNDPEWVEKTVASIEGRDPIPQPLETLPYELSLHILPQGDGQKDMFSVEFRPRIGTWRNFQVWFPMTERQDVEPVLLNGPAGTPPMGGTMAQGEVEDPTGEFHIEMAIATASHSVSFFLQCRELPSLMLFGEPDKLWKVELLESGFRPV